MKKITILACMILLILSSYSFAYVTNPGYKLFSELVSARAEKDGNVVGRIAAIKNDMHLKHHNDDTGFFGFFECINDQ